MKNMLRNFPIYFLLLFSTGATAQIFADLDTNNISARVRYDGLLFDGHFITPKGSNLRTLYTAGLWLGGIDPSGNLKLAAQTYAQGGADFFAGPRGYLYTDLNYKTRYERVWKISRAEIEYHQSNYNKPGYVMPASIRDWPGNGDSFYVDNWRIAPYRDVKKNYHYDPENGDYPIIRGDQAVIFVLNDNKAPHGSGGEKLDVEVFGMAYTYSRPNDSLLDNTVFVSYKIRNEGKTYSPFYLGVFADGDLGDSFDDYVGCDTLRNMIYTYNGDSVDGGTFGFGRNSPAVGIVMLNKKMTRAGYFNNFFGTTGFPNSAKEYYNFMRGFWKDSTAMTFGGDGYGGTQPSNYMYPGMPEYNTGWTEFSNPNIPSDRKGYMVAGPTSFPVGSEICLDLAFVFARETNGEYLSCLPILRERVDKLKIFYDESLWTCALINGLEEQQIYKDKLAVFPNPGKGLFQFQSNAVINKILVFNALGQVVYDSTINQVNAEIDLKNPAAGIYFYQIKMQSGNTLSGKLIVE